MPEVPFSFRALTTFKSDELNSTYMEGLTYTVREGYNELAALVPVWVHMGRIEIIGPANRSSVAGQGTLKWQ